MPLYIVHTRSAQHVNCGLWTVDIEGYGRARVWRTRIMRISFEGRGKREEGRGKILL